MKETYHKAAQEEISFRNIDVTYKDCLMDSFDSALTMLSWGKFHTEDFRNYVEGIKKIESHIIGERFKCTVCPNFDYCSNCKQLFGNIHGHAMEEVKAKFI